jgi:hypothetical protein
VDRTQVITGPDWVAVAWDGVGPWHVYTKDGRHAIVYTLPRRDCRASVFRAA